MTRRLVCSVFVAGFILTTSVFAQPEVDPGFGNHILTNGHGGWVKDMLVQPDDKVVMVSACPHFEDGNFPFCAARLNSNGSPDISFVGAGNRVPSVVRTRVPGTTSPGETFGVALQSDGKLILVGYVTQPGLGQVLAM